MTTALSIAKEYIRQGLGPTPVAFKSKKPTAKGWPKLRIDETNVDRYFDAKPQNIGIRMGQASRGVVDIDVDHPEALRLAKEYLPPTPAIFGRSSKPESHLLYVPMPTPKTKKWEFPDGAMILELRSDGSQTVFPGSVHESGEAIRWDREGEPARIDAAELVAAVERLAVAVGWKCNTERNAIQTKHAMSVLSDLSVLHEGGLSELSVLQTADEAIIHTLPTGSGQRHRCLFRLARRLKAIPDFQDAGIDALRVIVRRWHELATPIIRTKPWAETWSDFGHAWMKVKHPHGSGQTYIEELLMNLKPNVWALAEYGDDKVAMLVTLCVDLQAKAGTDPFFISCATAADALKVEKTTVWRWMNMLVMDGVIERVTKGFTGKASEYRLLNRIPPTPGNGGGP